MGLTLKNLSLMPMHYHAKFGDSAAIHPSLNCPQKMSPLWEAPS